MAQEYKLHDFSKVISDIKKLITDTHDVKQIKGYFTNYSGEDNVHYSVLAGNLSIKENVCRKGMKSNKEQDRDLLDVILSGLFRLGYEQAKIEDGNDITKQFSMKLLENFSKQLEEEKNKRV